MTNFPLFPPFFFPHRNYLHLFYIYVYICSTFVLFVRLFVSLFVLHPLSDSLLLTHNHFLQQTPGTSIHI